VEKTGFKNVDEYIATFPEATQDALRAVRAAVREGAPEAEEVISYQMAGYRFHGLMIYFAGFKQHYSLFLPGAEGLLEAFGDELRRHHVSKATFRFSLNEPVPVDLIRNVARHRQEEFRGRGKAKRTKA
jgi:uncharacterized protein YdhG (YjbR/CyaY superfamily)